MLFNTDIKIVNSKKNWAFTFFSIVAFINAVVFLLKDLYFGVPYLIVLDLITFILMSLVVYRLANKKKLTQIFNLGNAIVVPIIQFMYILYVRIDIMTLFFLMMFVFVVIFSDAKTQKYEIIAIAILYTCMIACYFFIDLSFLNFKTANEVLVKVTKFIFIAQLPLFTLLGMYVSSINTKLLFEYQDLISESHKIFESTEDCIDLSQQNQLKELSNKDINDFQHKFTASYPIFTAKILAIAPNLVTEEMKVIALLYFNYSTKEIAVKTNSSFRAIDAKKYRIRKKLNISSEKDISVFLHSL